MPRSPAGAALPSDPGAAYSKSITIDAAALEPMITYGTNPGMGMGITDRVPTPDDGHGRLRPPHAGEGARVHGSAPGQPLLGQKVDIVFIGSCTNSRISDLRQAAALLEGRTVAEGVRVMVVPGSQQVKAQAEQEGLADIFRAAGADWREAGCSMCIAMNGDQGAPGEYIMSHQQPQLRGPPGQGRPHVPRLAADGRRQRPGGRRQRPAAARRSQPGSRGEQLAMAEPFTTFTSALIPLPAENVDTDQIIPARFLKTTEKSGLADALFNDWRY